MVPQVDLSPRRDSVPAGAAEIWRGKEQRAVPVDGCRVWKGLVEDLESELRLALLGDHEAEKL